MSSFAALVAFFAVNVVLIVLRYQMPGHERPFRVPLAVGRLPGTEIHRSASEHIARHPRTDYIAHLVGLNLYRGEAEGHTVRLEGGPGITTEEDLTGPVFVAFPPGAVTLHRDRPSGSSARNLWQCRVEGLETHGDQIRVDLTGELPLAADLTTVAAAELGLHPGSAVWATVKAAQTHAYPA